MNNQLMLRGDMLNSVADLMQISEILVRSGMLPKTVTTKEAAAAIILKGREIGMPMMESFALINVIQGKPTIAPQGMVALVRRTGLLEYLNIEHNPANTATTVRAKRKGEPETVTTFSDEDARAMGLLGKENWQKQKAVMRQWRAIAANFRVTFADVIGGMYPPEELGAETDEDGELTQPETKIVPLAELAPTDEAIDADSAPAPTPAPASTADPLRLLRAFEAQYTAEYAHKPREHKAQHWDAQQIVFALKATAIGTDDDLRHALKISLFGKQDITSAQRTAMRKWLDTDAAKTYITAFVRQRQAVPPTPEESIKAGTDGEPEPEWFDAAPDTTATPALPADVTAAIDAMTAHKVVIPSIAPQAAPTPPPAGEPRMTRTQKQMLMEVFLARATNDEIQALKLFDAKCRAQFNKSQYEISSAQAQELLNELQPANV